VVPCRKLLLMLQEEEKKQKQLEREKVVGLDEIAMLRDKLHHATRDFSAIEAKIKEQLSRVRYQHDKLSKEHDELTHEHRALQKLHAEESEASRTKVEGLEKQLNSYKGLPYQLLDRLQQTEDRMRTAMDERERLEKRVKVMEEQNATITAHLDDAIKRGNVFKEKMELLQRSLPPLESELATTRSRLDFERRDKVQLERQLWEMSQTISTLLQRQALVEEGTIHKEKKLNDIIKGKDKEGRQTFSELSSKDRTLFKQRKRIEVLEDALSGSQKEIDSLKAQLRSTAHDPALPYNFEVQSMARKRLYDMHTKAVASLTVEDPASEAVPEAVQALHTLDLCNCALTNEDFASLLEYMRLCPYIRDVDVSNNLLTDEVSYTLSDFIRSKTCAISSLVARGNQFSAQAIRRFAVALEANSARGVAKVVIRQEGILEAFAAPPPPREDSSESEESQPSQAVDPIITLDVRDNLLGRGVAKAEAKGADSPQKAQREGVSRGGMAKTSQALLAMDVTGEAQGGEMGPGSGGVASTIRQIQSSRAFRDKVVAQTYGKKGPNRP
jgi:hypothetical protein